MSNFRLNINDIKREVLELSNGEYLCISRKYEGWDKKLKFRCPKGHIFYMTLASFRRGYRCHICSNRKRYTTKDIEEELSKFGYRLLSEYTRAKDKLEVLCPNGHHIQITWDHFRRGVRCRECGSRRLISIEYIRLKAVEKGWLCLSDQYLGPHKKLKFLCNREHEFETTWADMQQGHGCKFCVWEDLSQKFSYHYTIEELRELKNYRLTVNRKSEINYKKFKSLINPFNLKRGKLFHLDHIYSVADGFKNNIDPDLVASPVNLRILTRRENIVKNGNSDFTLEELVSFHKQFVKEISDLKWLEEIKSK